jgi:hypothetical protein
VHTARRPVSTIRLPAQGLPGHAKGDGQHVLSRRPDCIILGSANGTPAPEPWFPSDLEIAMDPRFAQSYRLRQVRIDVSTLPGLRESVATRDGVMTFTDDEKATEP